MKLKIEGIPQVCVPLMAIIYLQPEFLLICFKIFLENVTSKNKFPNILQLK